MPKLDFMVLADYVRTDAGVMHIMAAGIDTFTAPSVPTAKPVSVAIRLTVDHEDMPGRELLIKLIFAGDDKVLATVSGRLTVPTRPESLPIHWKLGLGLVLPIVLPFPDYGDYSLTLTLDDGELHSADLRVIPSQGNTTP